MALQTRNIAKNVPPRVLLPKSTQAKKNGIKKAVLTKKIYKRHASTGGDESEEQSKDLEPKARKKKRARHEAITSEEEVEEVEEVDDHPVSMPLMEHVNDMHDESEQSNEDEVSTMTT
jgi:intein/homing endonuclease